MLGTEYIKSLEDRINSLIASARIKYQDLKKRIRKYRISLSIQ